jgi:hypothetical protein
LIALWLGCKVFPVKDLTGIERIKQAVYAADATKQKVTEAELALAKARAENQAAEEALASLVASGVCSPENGCAHDSKVNLNGKHVVKPLYALNDEDVPKVYRICYWLLANPILDYGAVAEGIWGPGLDATTAKNRVGAHLTQAKKLEIVVSLGGNKYRVDTDALAKHSGLPVVEAAS